MVCGCIFHQDHDLKQTSKPTQKCVTEHKTKLLPWPSQSPDLNPKENEWSELKRRSTSMEVESEGSGEILHEGMISDLSSDKLLSKLIMWDVLLLFSSICTAVVVGAPDTVTGHRGERVEIRCPYKPGYESNSKYFCKGDCLIIGFKNIMVESGSPAQDERFSLTDDTTNRVFTVTITDLRTEDKGLYWCVVERRTLITDLSLTDLYSEILLQVKQESKTDEVSTISPFPKTPSHFSTADLNPQSTDMNPTDHHVSAGAENYFCVED
ncbi:CMRF35-like molecule 3 [Chanodichthys erythropterus]|uniref:CMRF35-like molecule 3 n=1 Tax=Chanodichthys erythropterus TaxID=933992 RepID=UPI00351ED44D